MYLILLCNGVWNHQKSIIYGVSNNQYLEKAKMIKLLNETNRYISRLQKPNKLFLDNPNLFYALNPEMVNIGSLRETFALNQLSVKHEVFLHKRADFIVDNKYVIEI